MAYVFGEIEIKSAQAVNVGVRQVVVGFDALHDDELEWTWENGTAVTVDVESYDS